MGIWTRSLKFNVGTGGIHQLPQTTGDGIHSLLQEVVWDVGDNLPNPVLQLFHCARFCPVHLLLRPAPQESHRAWDLDFLQAVREILVVPANVPAPARNGVSTGEYSSLFLTPYVPCASTVHFREQPDLLIYAGCGWTYPAPTPRSPQIGLWMDGHFSVRP